MGGVSEYSTRLVPTLDQVTQEARTQDAHVYLLYVDHLMLYPVQITANLCQTGSVLPVWTCMLVDVYAYELKHTM